MTYVKCLPRKPCGISLALLAMLCLASSSWSAEAPRYLGLTILHTNDIHGHVFPLDSYDNDGAKVHLRGMGGVARQATLIRQIRKASEYPVLVMSAGDVFTRGPIADMNGVPDFDVMNMIPYDVMTLGNNEFEGGEDLAGQKVLFDRIGQARFPVLAANVLYKANGKTIAQPYKIFEVDGVKVGVFGLTAPRVANYTTAKGLDVRDPIDVAKAIVSELREKADFIIALTHIGYDNGQSPCDLTLAAQVPGIDVIIGGDSHTWLPQPTLVREGKDSDSPFYVGGTVVNQAGEWGQVVAKLDLRLRRGEGHRYRLMSYSAKLVDVDSTRLPAKDIDRLLAHYTRSLRKGAAHLSKDISKSEMGNWLAQCLRETAGAQIGMAVGWTIEDGLKAGRVDSLALRRMYPSPTAILKVSATGKQIKDFIAAQTPVLAGAKMVDGDLYIGDEKAIDTQNYTVAVEDAWGLRSSALGSAQISPSGLTIRDAVVMRLKKGGHQ